MRATPAIIDPVFEPLPRRAKKRSSTARGLEAAMVACRAKPMTWAKVAIYGSPSSAGSLARAINSGKHDVFKTDFAATIRRLDDGKAALYMRFVGEEEESDGG